MRSRPRGCGARAQVDLCATPAGCATLVNFPRAKLIFTFPKAMTPAGGLQVQATVKEALVDELRSQVERLGLPVQAGRAERIERTGETLTVHLAGGAARRGRRVLVAIGRSGDFRRLGVPAESLDKVYNRLYDPADYRGQAALVVGGGDSAVETAIALAQVGARVTLSYGRSELARAKREVQGLRRRLGDWDRTPKTGDGGAGPAQSRYASRRSWSGGLELVLVLYFAALSVLAWREGHARWIPFLLVIMVGLAYVGVNTVRGRLGVARARGRAL